MWGLTPPGGTPRWAEVIRCVGGGGGGVPYPLTSHLSPGRPGWPFPPHCQPAYFRGRIHFHHFEKMSLEFEFVDTRLLCAGINII